MKTYAVFANFTHYVAALAVFVAFALSSCQEQPTEAASSPSVSTFTPAAITLREMPGSNLKELVDEQLIFVDSSGTEWIAPRGTLTDGASVPRLALWVTDGRFESEFLKAAIVHDAYCQADNAARCPEQYKKRPWKAVHRMFYEALLAGGTAPTKARIMFAAVWLGGPRWGDPTRSLEQVPEEVLVAEFEACQQWIEKNDPTIAEIEAWMDKREPNLLAAQ